MRTGFLWAANLALAAVLAGCSTSSSSSARMPETPTGPTIVEGPARDAEVERGGASYYSDRLAGRPTASGEPYEPAAYTAAHRTLPFGTVVEVVRSDGRRVEVKINDRGPHRRGRIIDLSRRAAESLGMIRDGVVEVTVRVLRMPERKKKR